MIAQLRFTFLQNPAAVLNHGFLTATLLASTVYFLLGSVSLNSGSHLS
jgi:hypothetical protein